MINLNLSTNLYYKVIEKQLQIIPNTYKKLYLKYFIKILMKMFTHP